MLTIEKKDLYTIKRFTWANGSEDIGFLVPSNWGYKIITVEGEEKSTPMCGLEKIQTVRTIPKEIRQQFNELAKYHKKIGDTKDKIAAQIKELNEQERQCKNDFRDSLVEYQEYYAKETGVLTDAERETYLSLMKEELDKYKKTDVLGGYYSDLYFFKPDEIMVRIVIYAERYPGQGSFDGLAYLEYDNTVHVFDEPEAIEKFVIKHNDRGRGPKYKQIVERAKEISGSEYEIKITPDIDIGDKVGEALIKMNIELKDFANTKESWDQLLSDYRSILKW